MRPEEIKKLFHYNLRNFTLQEVVDFYRQFQQEENSRDEFEFLLYLKEQYPERFIDGRTGDR